MIMLNRKFISDDIKADSKIDDTRLSENNNVMILQYKDRKKINLMSTIKNNQSISIDAYDKAEKKKIEKEKPLLVFDYSHNMKAVDRNNQLSSYYSIDLKHFKWWRCILLKLFDVSMSNAYLIYRHFNRGSYDHKYFYLYIIENLLKEYNWKNQIIDTCLDIKSYFSKLENKKKLRRCKNCSANGIRKNTYFYCNPCYETKNKIKPICQICQKEHFKK